LSFYEGDLVSQTLSRLILCGSVVLLSFEPLHTQPPSVTCSLAQDIVLIKLIQTANTITESSDIQAPRGFQV